MRLDVLLIGAGCKEYFPAFVPPRLAVKRKPYCRTGEIIEVFKNNLSRIRTEEFREDDLSQYEGKMFQFYGTEYFCFTYNPNEKKLCDYVFESVDTERPWTIVNLEEGGEHLHYFEKGERFVVKDTELNYGEYL